MYLFPFFFLNFSFHLLYSSNLLPHILFKDNFPGAGEMAQGLGCVTVLQRTGFSFQHPHGAHDCPRGCDTSFWSLQALHEFAQIHTQTHAYTDNLSN